MPRPLGFRSTFAVLDPGARLKAFSRMNGTLFGSTDIALGKAKPAVLFRSGNGSRVAGSLALEDGGANS